MLSNFGGISRQCIYSTLSNLTQNWELPTSESDPSYKTYKRKRWREVTLYIMLCKSSGLLKYLKTKTTASFRENGFAVSFEKMVWNCNSSKWWDQLSNHVKWKKENNHLCQAIPLRCSRTDSKDLQCFRQTPHRGWWSEWYEIFMCSTRCSRLLNIL